jgi:hypothetical protein
LINEPPRKLISRQPVAQLTEFFTLFFLHVSRLTRQFLQQLDRAMPRVSQAEMIL